MVNKTVLNIFLLLFVLKKSVLNIEYNWNFLQEKRKTL